MKRVVWLILWIVLPDADVGAQSSHYQGKTLTIIVGSALELPTISMPASSGNSSVNIFPAIRT